MTLDEAIKHAEEVAEYNDKKAYDFKQLKDYGNPRSTITSGADNCIECADEHRQLAEWLKQLKEIKRILDAPSYEENGVTYSYCYESDIKLKHIREVVK